MFLVSIFYRQGQYSMTYKFTNYKEARAFLENHRNDETIVVSRISYKEVYLRG